jgi:N-methylhydantoinase A
MTGLSAVDIKNIGAGGGSIARIDSGGLLRVGPQSARAEPGPACYGRGGTLPTVTDASVVLGHIDPDFFLGGRIRLSREAAIKAIETHVAKPLGLTTERAAHAILTIANENMVNAIRSITINEGLDPRSSLLIGGGGAGGMTIGRIAEQLDCDRVLMPRTAGALSASGGLFSDIVTEFSLSSRTDTSNFDFDGINQALADLDAQMDAFFCRLGTSENEQTREFFVEARYPHQVWELEVPLAASRFGSEHDIQAMIEAFHLVHERIFAVSEPGRGIECIYWKARATAHLPKPDLRRREVAKDAAPGATATYDAWFGDDNPVPTPRFHGPSLSPEAVIAGPGIIQEPTTTIVVFPGWTARVLETGDYLMTRKA